MNSESTTIQGEVTPDAELQMLIAELRDFKQDVQCYVTTSQKAVKALNGPILCIGMSSEQKAAQRASEHTLNGILGEIDERFGRYL